MQWDVFCQVIDNYGDAGVCWRLATNLAQLGQRVRLWMDDASPLQWMAPDFSHHPAIEVMVWPAVQAQKTAIVHEGFHFPDVLVEAFGCDIPDVYLQALASQIGFCDTVDEACTTPVAVPTQRIWPVWLNLEYLSAEPYVERMHMLQSPIMFGLAKGQTKTFFYPGFTALTGGLLRELDVLDRQAVFDRMQWRAQTVAAHQLHHAQFSDCGPAALASQCDAQWISLFAYEPACLPQWLSEWASGGGDVVVLAMAGRSQTWLRQCWQNLGWGEAKAEVLKHGRLTVYALPHTSQDEFDQALWACDCNIVRGEDSLVRALWAGQPFLWNIYPQEDNAHHAKLNAFLNWLGACADWRAAMHLLNAMDEFMPSTRDTLPQSARAVVWPTQANLQQWRETAQEARRRLRQQPDLATALLHGVERQSSLALRGGSSSE
ncbi:elongation factor P maturation arginine rhamnosyltransferase EarP [Lampropedia puyangensis]|uniref:Protein-arginine rhamnosyltransferase n=1 Tax=Lampropedia puyangensis TaxID=1330072 RepID=A0A4S8F3C2_9BURK|nr:elongation factor P maturation arginine rhamnosyltransferase EarP [Lampropedia puyangensis]THU00624.1 elongation factor P maturation arginine rhamnosyltransferase EarP [Lampropedia puyangensis]